MLDRDGQLPLRCLIVNENIGQRVTIELARLLAASAPGTVRQRSAAHPYWTPVHLFCASSAALCAELVALLSAPARGGEAPLAFLSVSL